MIDYKGLKVKKDGTIIGKRGKPLAGGISNGYKVCWFEGGTKYQHRIVYEAFNGPIPEGTEIDHINRDKTDNNVDNLRAVTHKENANNRVHISPKRHLNDEQVKRIKDLYSDGYTGPEIAEQYGVSKFVVWTLLREETYQNRNV